MDTQEIQNTLNDKQYENLILIDAKAIRKYSASDGINITDDGKISVKIDNDTIVLNDDGELSAGEVLYEGTGIKLENDLDTGVTTVSSKVNGKDENAAYKTEEGIKVGLMINGGPLASQFSQIYPNGVIPVGTSIESLISKLIYAVHFSQITYQSTLSAEISAPIISFTPNTQNVEIGTTVNWSISNYILGDSHIVNPTNIVQKITATISQDSSGTSGRKAYSPIYGTLTNSKVYGSEIFTPTIGNNGTSSETDPVHPSGTGGQGLITSGSFVVTSENTYTVYASNTSATVTANKNGETIDTLFPMSNTGEIAQTGVEIKYNGASTVRPENNATKTVKGFYKVYYGSVGTCVTADDHITTDDVTVQKVKALNIVNEYNSSLGTKTFDAQKFCVIAVPQNKNVTRIYGIDALSHAEIDFTKFTSVSGFGADESLTYDIFYFPNGASKPYTLENIRFIS